MSDTPEWFTTANAYFLKKQGLSPVQKSIITNLLESDGELSPNELADRSSYDISTIYQNLDRIDEILQREYGSVRFNDTELSQAVQKTVEKYDLDDTGGSDQ